MFKKYIGGIMAVIVAVAAFAFTKPAPVSSKTMQVWQYSSSEPLSNAKNAALYTNITSGGGYTCSGLGNVCKVTFDTNKFANLQAYLNSFSTPAAVRDAAGTIQRS